VVPLSREAAVLFRPHPPCRARGYASRNQPGPCAVVWPSGGAGSLSTKTVGAVTTSTRSITPTPSRLTHISFIEAAILRRLDPLLLPLCVSGRRRARHRHFSSLLPECDGPLRDGSVAQTALSARRARGPSALPARLADAFVTRLRFCGPFVETLPPLPRFADAI